MNISGGLRRGGGPPESEPRGRREEKMVRSGADSGELEAGAEEVRIHMRREREGVRGCGGEREARAGQTV